MKMEFYVTDERSYIMRKPAFAYAKTKANINCVVTGVMMSAFVFAKYNFARRYM